MRIDISDIPERLLLVVDTLRGLGYDSYLTGGEPRNRVIKQVLGDTHTSHDWDMATEAPVDVMLGLQLPTRATIVPQGIDYGTVKFCFPGGHGYEFTQIRKEFIKRDADQVKGHHRMKAVFDGATLEDDMNRRDTRPNALAATIPDGKIIDLVGGVEAIKERRLHFVGEPKDRLLEDPNRLPRMIGQGAELQFSVDERAYEASQDPEVRAALKTDTGSRVGNELLRLLSVKDPDWLHLGIMLWFEFGLVDIWLPEIKRLRGMKQNYYHSHSVLGHTLLSLKAAVGQPLEVVLAALFHDVGKGVTQQWNKRGSAYGYSFYGHHMKGSDITRKIFRRLNFGSRGTEKYTFNTEEILHLIWNHMGPFNGHKFSTILNKLGVTQFGPHMLEYSYALSLADTKGRQFADYTDEHVDVFKEVTDSYPHDKIEKVYFHMGDVIERLALRYAHVKNKLETKPPLSLKDLGMNGTEVMEAFGYSPGPAVGQFLQYMFHKMLDEIGEQHEHNTTDSG